MNYIGNQDYWDEKFRLRGDKSLPADEALIKHLNKLNKGSVIDLACGDGRNALFLLENGFEVTGLDYSEQALKRLRKFADNAGYKLRTMKRDLRDIDAFDGLKRYDNILINHYKLHNDLIEKLPLLLKCGGVLLVTGFSKNHTPDAKIKEGDLIDISDFSSIENQVTIIETDQYSDQRGDFVTYVFKKIGPVDDR